MIFTSVCKLLSMPVGYFHFHATWFTSAQTSLSSFHTRPKPTERTRMLTGSGSTYRMRKCRAMERQMAPTSHGFDQGGIFSRDWFSDRLESTGRGVILLHIPSALSHVLHHNHTGGF